MKYDKDDIEAAAAAFRGWAASAREFIAEGDFTVETLRNFIALIQKKHRSGFKDILLIPLGDFRKACDGSFLALDLLLAMDDRDAAMRELNDALQKSRSRT